MEQNLNVDSMSSTALISSPSSVRMVCVPTECRRETQSKKPESSQVRKLTTNRSAGQLLVGVQNL